MPTKADRESGVAYDMVTGDVVPPKKTSVFEAEAVRASSLEMFGGFFDASETGTCFGKLFGWLVNLRTEAVSCVATVLNQLHFYSVGDGFLDNLASLYGLSRKIGESDSDLRLRLFGNKINSVDFLASVRSRIAAVEGVAGLCVLENCEGVTKRIRNVAMPPHSVFVAVDIDIGRVHLPEGDMRDADDLDAEVRQNVARALFETKSGGSDMLWLPGLTPDEAEAVHVEEPVVDLETGISYWTRFNRVATRDFYIKVFVERNKSTESDAAIAAGVLDALGKWERGEVVNVDGLDVGKSAVAEEAGAAVSDEIPELKISRVELYTSLFELKKGYRIRCRYNRAGAWKWIVPGKSGGRIDGEPVTEDEHLRVNGGVAAYDPTAGYRRHQAVTHTKRVPDPDDPGATVEVTALYMANDAIAEPAGSWDDAAWTEIEYAIPYAGNLGADGTGRDLTFASHTGLEFVENLTDSDGLKFARFKAFVFAYARPPVAPERPDAAWMIVRGDSDQYYFGFDTLQQAVNAARDGERICLEKDVETNECVSFDRPGVTVWLDFGGHDYTTTSREGAFKVLSGSLMAFDEKTKSAVRAVAAGAVAFSVSGGELVVDGLCVGGRSEEDRGYCHPFDVSGAGRLTIEHATCYCQDLAIHQADTGTTVTVRGGMFDTYDCPCVLHEGYGTMLLEGGMFNTHAVYTGGTDHAVIYNTTADSQIRITAGDFDTNLYEGKSENKWVTPFYQNTVVDGPVWITTCKFLSLADSGDANVIILGGRIRRYAHWEAGADKWGGQGVRVQRAGAENSYKEMLGFDRSTSERTFSQTTGINDIRLTGEGAYLPRFKHTHGNDAYIDIKPPKLDEMPTPTEKDIFEEVPVDVLVEEIGTGRSVRTEYDAALNFFNDDGIAHVFDSPNPELQNLDAGAFRLAGLCRSIPCEVWQKMTLKLADDERTLYEIGIVPTDWRQTDTAAFSGTCVDLGYVPTEETSATIEMAVGDNDDENAVAFGYSGAPMFSLEEKRNGFYVTCSGGEVRFRIGDNEESAACGFHGKTSRYEIVPVKGESGKTEGFSLTVTDLEPAEGAAAESVTLSVAIPAGYVWSVNSLRLFGEAEIAKSVPGELRGLEIKERGETVRNFKPCVRQDGVVQLIETVTRMPYAFTPVNGVG